MEFTKWHSLVVAVVLMVDVGIQVGMGHLVKNTIGINRAEAEVAGPRLVEMYI